METINTKDKRSLFIRLMLYFTPYIFCFFIFSFLGWLSETIYCYILYKSFLERGFLFSPICPIYGFGALILIRYFDKSNKKRNYIKLFFFFILIFSFFEYLTGFTMEAIFSERWWDYSDSKYNINGRITVFNSFLWGVATIIFAKFIYPLTIFIKEKIINKMPDLAKIIIDVALITGVLIDFAFSCVKYLK